METTTENIRRDHQDRDHGSESHKSAFIAVHFWIVWGPSFLTISYSHIDVTHVRAATAIRTHRECATLMNWILRHCCKIAVSPDGGP